MALPSVFTTGPGTGWIPASLGNYVPEIFSKKLQARFYANSVLPMVTNTDYEGEIASAGSKVVIRVAPTVTVADYTGTVSYAELAGNSLELVIDKAKSYAFKVDDLARAMSDIQFWNEASKDASERMRIAVETDVLGNIVTGATTVVDSAATVVTSSNILDYILDAGRKLDELNIPEEGRFLVLSPRFIEMLKKSELRQAYLTGDGTSPLRNGKVGMVDRFTIYQSNMLAAGAGGDANKTLCLAGTKHFATFASNFVKTETLRLETTFGDGVRGLKVYGYQVVVPNAGVALKLRHTA